MHISILLSSLSSACLLSSLQHSTHLGIMSGRGKGGKGLGKGGAKRHRKVLRDNIQVRLATLCNTPCSRCRSQLVHCFCPHCYALGPMPGCLLACCGQLLERCMLPAVDQPPRICLQYH